jgi:hypothetical protein
VEFLYKLQESGFSQWVRESDSLFAFAGILLIHTIGMGLVVGINAVIDLRVVGFAPALRLRAMEKFLPVLWLGFWMNALTGVILLVVDARRLSANLDFYVKLALIALAVINLQMLKREIFVSPAASDVPPSSKAKLLAVTSMLFWLGAITAGRLLAYVAVK